MKAQRGMLPEEGEEAGAGAEAVVGIAGEVAAEHFFFVQEAEDDQRDDEEEARERPPGAEGHWREEQHENGAEVHGMPDEPIGPVEMTRCPSSTWTVREAKLFSFMTQRVIR